MSNDDTLTFPLTGRVVLPKPKDPLRGEPFTVERFPSPAGTVWLTGYDRRGQVALELRVIERAYNKRLVGWMTDWLRSLDARALELVPDEQPQ